nr:hypothetical protein BaRGS_007620 [Batillaria attramentaria]
MRVIHDPVDPVLTTASPQSTSQASSFLADDVVDTSFHPYPSQRPFINTDYRRPGLESQLSSAETRCQLLEKQLDYMKKMVQNAEVERSQAEQKAEVLQRQTEPSPLTPDYRAQLDRIGMLERDHLRLTATQTLAEAKIKELEEKLRDERNHRHMLQERALDLESAAISHKILLDTAPIPNKNTTSSTAKSKKMSAVKKKKKKPAPKKPLSAKSEPMKHYRLNLAEIPFVAGKSTAPSHAVGANVQKVLAMMKSHNLALCSSLYNGHSCNGDLGEHQEYMRQIHEAKDPRIREDLERELDSLVVRMEAKGQQISKVRQHQQKLEDAKRQARKPVLWLGHDWFHMQPDELKRASGQFCQKLCGRVDVHGDL